MKYLKKFEGERIYLSPLNIDDVLKYTYWMSDRNVTDNLGNTVNVMTIEGEKEWFINAEKNGNVNFSIVKKENNELLGNCALMKIDRINRHCLLGIFIGDKNNRHKGYGTEALKLLLKYSFDFQNMHNVSLVVFSFNENAIKCYEKIGFKKCGVKHESYFLDGKYYDEVYMEMLESEYRGLKN